jgi:phosphate:Na+ symporter
LDDTVLQTPAVALEPARRALRETAAESFRALRGTLRGPADGGKPPDSQLRQALDRLQAFFPKNSPSTEDAPLSQLRVAQPHAMDHLARPHPRLTPPPSVRRVLDQPRLERRADGLCKGPSLRLFG